MKPAAELKLLRSFRRQLDQLSFGPFGKSWFLIAMWFVLVAAFLAIFQGSLRYHWSTFTVTIVSFALGFVCAWALIQNMAIIRWLAVRRFVNREMVDQRIQELQTETSAR